MNFECHITLPREHAALGAEIAKTWGWKTSEIARDPVLGDDTHFYLTKHSTDYMNIFAAMTVVGREVVERGGSVLRAKIELIMYDVRGPNYADQGLTP